ncbi:unnamed protein product [Prunus armeniaca]|uniref:EF-hand domain-containing protein n=1 Tax=Prunus armeniaca TaxID=36596 RepID=A0A6J5UKC3_PRUAR|nr:unnamed protein product [Prunus armeniaca]
MEEFDISGDSQIVETEFVNGISKWINPAKPSANDNSHEHKSFFRRNPKNEKTKEDQKRPVEKKKKANGADKSWTNLVKAAYLLILGTGITVLLAVPPHTNYARILYCCKHPFILNLVCLIPWATNYKLALRSVTSAREKTDNAISLTLSEEADSVSRWEADIYKSLKRLSSTIVHCGRNDFECKLEAPVQVHKWVGAYHSLLFWGCLCHLVSVYSLPSLCGALNLSQSDS